MPQQAPLRLGQQLVAPVQRRAQRLMPRQRGAPAAGKQCEAIVEAPGDLLDAERRRPGRSELDGERNAVELPADRGDRRQLLALRRKSARSERVRATNSCTALCSRTSSDASRCCAGTSSAGTR